MYAATWVRVAALAGRADQPRIASTVSAQIPADSSQRRRMAIPPWFPRPSRHVLRRREPFLLRQLRGQSPPSRVAAAQVDVDSGFAAKEKKERARRAAGPSPGITNRLNG